MATTPQIITNQELLHADAVALGYAGPMMSSESALTWIVANGQTLNTTNNNSQNIAQNKVEIKKLQQRGEFLGNHLSIKAVDAFLTAAGTAPKNGDTVLIGSATETYRLYTFLDGAWEFGSKSMINVVDTFGQLPNALDVNTGIGLSIDDKGTQYFVRDESAIYLWIGANWQAVTTPTVINGFKFSLVLS